MIMMECDDCSAKWECAEGQLDEKCPECGGTAVHRHVGDPAMTRMLGLLGKRKTTPERLKAAFAACTSGGEVFADAVLAKAVATGHIELIDGFVWQRDPDAR